MTSDDDSIPYKKDTTEDNPESSDNVGGVDVVNNSSYPYQYQDSDQSAQYPQQQPYPQQQQYPQQFQQPQSSRQFAGETEIN